MSDEDRAGFLPTMVRIHTKREMHKPLFGKPQIKYGQTFIIAGYMFQLGGLLGAAFQENLEPFLTAYHGTPNIDVTIQSVPTDLEQVTQFGDSVNTLTDFVIALEDKRWNIPEGSLGALAEHGTRKLPHDIAFHIPWELGMLGATLGLRRPETYRTWFENNFRISPERRESCIRAHKAGLNIPTEPDVVTYEELEQDALDMFIPFVGEFFPELKDALVPHSAG